MVTLWDIADIIDTDKIVVVAIILYWKSIAKIKPPNWAF